MRFLGICLALACLVQPADARQVRMLHALSVDVTQGLQIKGMDLLFTDSFLTEQAESDAKAARKREEAGLPPLDPTSYATGPSDPDLYRTLPFKQMFPLVIRDVTRDWGLTQGRAVKLRITLENLKTADAAVAILLAPSYDNLVGTVDVIDAGTDQPLGSFRVDVVNVQNGWANMLMRGWSVREKLAREFGLELSRTLSGKKRKPQETAMNPSY